MSFRWQTIAYGLGMNDPHNWLRSPRALAMPRILATSFIGLILATTSLSAAEMTYPLAVAVAKDGHVYVADRKLPGVWSMSADGPTIFFQAAKRFRSALTSVRCLSVDNAGRLLAGDTATRDVYRFDESSQPVALTSGSIGLPMGIAVSGTGAIFVSDLETGRIMKVPEAGGPPSVFAKVSSPRGLSFDARGRLWVVSHGKNQLLRVSSDGSVSAVVQGRPFRFPHDVAVGEKGLAYVSDGYAKTIWQVDEAGTTTQWAQGAPLKNPVGLAWMSGKLLIADSAARMVFEASADGKLKPFKPTAAD